MGFFEKGNPVGVFVYFLAAALGAMFCLHPAVVAVSLFGGIGAYFALGGRGGFKEHGFWGLVLVGGTVLNALFNHRGETVLLFINDNPVTMEALVYGVLSSASIVGIIYWFRAFSVVMTGDRLLYVFGTFSPKMALVLSMALRYIPLFGTQAGKTSDALKAVGADGGDSFFDGIRSKLKVFWVMVTWTLENGIITADSMESRGYGAGKRTFFSLYRFRATDALVIAVSLGLDTLFFGGLAGGALDLTFYPKICFGDNSWLTWAAFAAYGVIAVLPLAVKLGEGIKWKLLKSEI